MYLIEKAKSNRNLMIEQIRKGFKMTIRSNLSSKERAILLELREDKSIIICPADDLNFIPTEAKGNREYRTTKIETNRRAPFQNSLC